MLTVEQTREFGRRVRDLFNRRGEEGVSGVACYDGWFPTNVDEIVTDLLAGEDWAGDAIQVALVDEAAEVDLNAGYEDSPVQFELDPETDSVLVARVRLRANVPASQNTVSVNRTSGAVTVNGVSRALPEGYVYLVSTIRPTLDDGCAVLRLNVRTVQEEVEAVDADYYDYDGDDDYTY